MRKVYYYVLLTFISVVPPSSLYAEPVVTTATIVGSVSTALLINNIRTLLNDAMDKAQNTGNFFLFKGATELKSAIDTWEKANANLLDKAFQDLNESQRKFFADANATAQNLNQDVSIQMEDAKKVAETVAQIVADIRIFDGHLGLFRYSPRVVYPGMPESQSFIFRGVNFDEADPQLILPNGETATRVSLSKQEAVFSVPTAAFNYHDTNTSLAKLKFSYLNPSDGFLGTIADFFQGRTKRDTTDISVMQLPQVLGNYALYSKTKDTVREEWTGERQFHWSGRDESRTENQGPHDNGWRIIISSLHQGKVWGEAGNGCHILSNNEHGFSVEIRVGTIRKLFDPNAPGYQHCIYHWKEYIERQVINEQATKAGEIKWTKDEPFELPVNKESFQLKITLFNGIERSIFGSQTEPFYKVVESGKNLVIQPQIPNDLNGL